MSSRTPSVAVSLMPVTAAVLVVFVITGAALPALPIYTHHDLGSARLWWGSWLAPTAFLGFAGAALTGFGYSFVYPGLGIEAVRRAPAESRGTAMGIYTAFLDVALGVLSPLLGLLAGLSSVFGVSCLPYAPCPSPRGFGRRPPRRCVLFEGFELLNAAKSTKDRPMKRLLGTTLGAVIMTTAAQARNPMSKRGDCPPLR